ncbi:copper homeostasis protein [Granulicella aggregans]|uniref:PF03932 family protein CutC n=1 Tax=Granulicella aggregans TaxID=474949 RepID=A0A7W8E864_9BACT|nr:copper homeostasis protein CutC [Granulicella aggregans]MBB5060965.1 copper homeostasis protein [Granulicella aggregans]
MRNIVFELCAETIDACLAARDGGAARIELCSGLSEGGLTPSHALICAAIEHSGLPVHVLIRPRGGDFLYREHELSVMRDDVAHAKSLGASGVVLGILAPDGTVDIPTTRSLVELAYPMKVTFHRAFDVTPSLSAALEDVIATGCDRILTSGGQRNVVAGTQTLSQLVVQAGSRIDIAVGGGLRLQNAPSLSRLTVAAHFHGSLRRRLLPKAGRAAGDGAMKSSRNVVAADDIRTVIRRLQNT